MCRATGGNSHTMRATSSKTGARGLLQTTQKNDARKTDHEKNDDAVQYKFVYILQEIKPRLHVRHKCVKGCGDLRDINFIRMSLQSTSERFF